MLAKDLLYAVTVSYTHLCQNVLTCFDKLPDSVNDFEQTLHWYFLMPECINSVSYTHLDVYKRQILLLLYVIVIHYT